MKLYTLPGACSLGPHIVLAWIGKPYEVEIVARDALKTSYLAINPSGSVPALQLDDGDVLVQNVAILEYLADSSPEANLIGSTLRERAETMRWLAHVNSDVHKWFAPIFGPGQYADDDAGKELVQAKAKLVLRGLYEKLDAHLQDRDWLANNRRSIADPYLFVTLRWARGKGVDLSGLDNLARFMANMRADAGVQAAMAAEGLA